MIRIFALTLFLVPFAAAAFAQEAVTGPTKLGSFRTVKVSGTGTHFFSTAIVHSQRPTETGFIQRSTDTVELEGDLKGRVLYHPVSTFDTQAQTLENRGHQVFSGTVLGSNPVLLYDNRFRFEVNLATGETVGKVYLADQLAGPSVRCWLEIVGTGQDAQGDSTLAYTGYCRLRVPVEE